jgi:hypothetical protein
MPVQMTTAPGCGMGPIIASEARQKILTIDGVDASATRLGSPVDSGSNQRGRQAKAWNGLGSQQKFFIPLRQRITLEP